VISIYPFSVASGQSEDQLKDIEQQTESIIKMYFHEVLKNSAFDMRAYQESKNIVVKNDILDQIRANNKKYFYGPSAIFDSLATIITGCNNKSPLGINNLHSSEMSLEQYFTFKYIKGSEAATYKDFCTTNIDLENNRVIAKFRSKNEVEKPTKRKRKKSDCIGEEGYYDRIVYFSLVELNNKFTVQLNRIEFEDKGLDCIKRSEELLPAIYFLPLKNNPEPNLENSIQVKAKIVNVASRENIRLQVNDEEITDFEFNNELLSFYIVQNNSPTFIAIEAKNVEGSKNVKVQIEPSHEPYLDNNIDNSLLSDTLTITELSTKDSSSHSSELNTALAKIITDSIELRRMGQTVEDLQGEVDSLSILTKAQGLRIKSLSIDSFKLSNDLVILKISTRRLKKSLKKAKETIVDLEQEIHDKKEQALEAAKTLLVQYEKLEKNIENTIFEYERFNHKKTIFFGLNFSLFNSPSNKTLSSNNNATNLSKTFNVDYPESNFGLSMYHNIGFYISNLRFKRGNTPRNSYSLLEVQQATDKLRQENIPFQDLNYVRSGSSLSTFNMGFHIYPNIVNGLYLSIGLSKLKGEVWDYYEGDLKGQLQKENNLYVVDHRHLNLVGLYTGVAYVAPYFQAEVGYNFLYKEFNLSIGCNYPLGSAKKIKSRKNNPGPIDYEYNPKLIKITNPDYETGRISRNNRKGKKTVSRLKTDNQSELRRKIYNELIKRRLSHHDRQFCNNLITKDIIEQYINSLPANWFTNKTEFYNYKKKLLTTIKESYFLKSDGDEDKPKNHISNKGKRIILHRLDDFSNNGKLTKVFQVLRNDYIKSAPVIRLENERHAILKAAKDAIEGLKKSQN